MSAISDWQNRDCFVWAVERPIESRVRHSRTFTVCGQQCYFQFKLDDRSAYSMHLLSSQNIVNEFSLTIHVEDRSRCALPLSKHTYVYCDSSSYPRLVWSYPKSDILKAVPDFLTNGLLIFLVTLHGSAAAKYTFHPEPPIVIEIEKEDKSIQTDEADPKQDKSTAYSCLESLSSDFSELLEQGSRSDVVLVCGDTTISVHKTVICARSKVIAAMLETDMTEGRTNKIKISDMKQDLLDHFVRYLYTGILPELTVDSAKCFYEAGDKYAVSALMTACANFLHGKLELGNACEILSLADAHSDWDLKEKVTDYILEKEILLQDEYWMVFCEQYPKLATEVLKRFCKLQRAYK